VVGPNPQFLNGFLVLFAQIPNPSNAENQDAFKDA